jgi:hypothetical protein
MASSSTIFDLEWLFRCEQQHMNDVILPRAEHRMAQEPVLQLLLAERRATSRRWRLVWLAQRRMGSARRATLHALAGLLTRAAERLREWAATHPATQA